MLLKQMQILSRNLSRKTCLWNGWQIVTFDWWTNIAACEQYINIQVSFHGNIPNTVNNYSSNNANTWQKHYHLHFIWIFGHQWLLLPWSQLPTNNKWIMILVSTRETRQESICDKHNSSFICQPVLACFWAIKDEEWLNKNTRKITNGEMGLIIHVWNSS